MPRLARLLTLASLLMFYIPAHAEPIGECLPCHREKTPAAVRQWEESAHFKARVGCEKCHGTDHERMLKGEARVDQAVCAPCHKKAFDGHRKSRHGLGLHSGWGCTRNLPDRDRRECTFCHEEGSTIPISTVQCARFLKQSTEMGEVGCNYCHNVESSCASCHTNHGTDLKFVRDPISCAKCHMGPDHPQWEMWQTSLHGSLYTVYGERTGPTCQTCHMPGGSHNVSFGITMSSGGIPHAPDKAKPAREEMIGVCSSCHAAGFARRELARGDAIQKQSLTIVKEAEKIIWDLYDNALLDPMPANRPPHPLSGNKLVTDNQLLYEDTSHIERLLFKMKKYDYAKTVKGAFHQNPAYTHWLGNAELKLNLTDIRAEASRLRNRAAGPAATAAKPAADSLEHRLQVLKNKFDRGAITADDYGREKGKILQEVTGGK